MTKDEYYMNMAIRLARKGEGMTNPNPMVGAVLVKGGKVIAKGYHKKAGLRHAEVIALDNAGKRAKGSTLYVNLEPCDSFGKTPPCTQRIIKDGVKRVVIGMRDPNLVNYGRGIRRLRQNGIEVRCGVLGNESRQLNRVFETYITEKRPYVSIKAAQSIDGKIATFTGDSRWITNELSRRFAHRLRGRADALLVGVNTVIRDDPLLNARIKKGAKKQPMRVILDANLRTPLSSKVINDGSSKTLIAAARGVPKRKIARLKKKNVDVVYFKKKKNLIDLGALLRYLAKNGVSHLLVEGGGNVIGSFIDAGLADELFIFVSPRIIGGRDALTSVEGRGARYVRKALVLKDIRLKRFREDLLIRGYVHRAD